MVTPNDTFPTPPSVDDLQKLLDNPECPIIPQLWSNHGTDGRTVENNTERWVHGLLSVVIISICSITGAVIVPLLQHHPKRFKYMMLFLISLAVSALSGAANLVLLPEGLGLDSCDMLISRNISACGGIFCFFIIHRILQTSLKSQHTHSHSIDGSNKKPSNEKNNMAINHGPVQTRSRTSTIINDTQEENQIIYEDEETESFQRSDEGSGKITDMRSVGWMILIGDAAHNFLDGVALGATFINLGVAKGWQISIAILAEEFPHELGDYAVLINSGLSTYQAIICNLVSASTALIGFFFGAFFGGGIHGYIFSWMAGVFLFISLGNMLPEVEAIIGDLERKYKSDWKFLPSIVAIVGMAAGYSIVYSCLFIF